MEIECAAITETDIDAIKNTSACPIKFSEISKHAFFSKPIQLLKLTSVLAILRDQEKVAKIVEGVDAIPELRDLAALEVLLGVARLDLAQVSGLSSDVMTCLKANSDLSTITLAEMNSVTLICRIQLIKYAALKGNFPLIKFVASGLNKSEKDSVEAFAVSLGRFAAIFLDRVNVNADHETWIKYCAAIEENLCETSSHRLGVIRSSRALLVANKGDLNEAAKLLNDQQNVDKFLKTSISVRLALRHQKFDLASDFADVLIPKTFPMDAMGAFSRETAEFALKRVNTLLTSAGLKPFLISGTLLGCIREGRIFEHDKDFDIGMFGWESQYDVAAALLKSGEFAFSVKDLRGSKLYLLPVRHVPSGFDFDIFFFHDHGDYFLHGIDFRLGYTLNYKFSKFDLISWNFIGDSFYIPETYETMLTENYGPNWRVPDPSYFVKLEAPALVNNNADLSGFVARHEMLDLIQKRGSVEKAQALIACIKRVLPKQVHPSHRVCQDFLQQVRDGRKSAAEL